MKSHRGNRGLDRRFGRCGTTRSTPATTSGGATTSAPDALASDPESNGSRALHPHIPRSSPRACSTRSTSVRSETQPPRTKRPPPIQPGVVDTQDASTSYVVECSAHCAAGARRVPTRRAPITTAAASAAPEATARGVYPNTRAPCGSRSPPSSTPPSSSWTAGSFRPERIQEQLTRSTTTQTDEHTKLISQLNAELQDIDKSQRRQSLRMEEHHDPRHPVVTLAKERITELSARRQEIETSIRAIEALHTNAVAQDHEIEAALDVIPDLRTRLRSATTKELAEIFENFDLVITYDRPKQSLRLTATLHIERRMSLKETRPPKGRSGKSPGSGGGIRTLSCDRPRSLQIEPTRRRLSHRGDVAGWARSAVVAGDFDRRSRQSAHLGRKDRGGFGSALPVGAASYERRSRAVVAATAARNVPTSVLTVGPGALWSPLRALRVA